MITIGLGTGRCGTKSLAEIFAAQDNTISFHELTPTLPWTFNRQLALQHYNHLRYKENDFGHVCSVSWFYLQYIKFFHEIDSTIKFVYLYRDRASCVQSMLNWAYPHHYFTALNGTQNECFPKIEALNPEDRVSIYYDLYTSIANSYTNESYFRSHNMLDLNDATQLTSLLQWCGFVDPQPVLRRSNRNLNMTYRSSK